MDFSDYMISKGGLMFVRESLVDRFDKVKSTRPDQVKLMEDLQNMVSLMDKAIQVHVLLEHELSTSNRVGYNQAKIILEQKYEIEQLKNKVKHLEEGL